MAQASAIAEGFVNQPLGDKMACGVAWAQHDAGYTNAPGSFFDQQHRVSSQPGRNDYNEVDTGEPGPPEDRPRRQLDDHALRQRTRPMRLCGRPDVGEHKITAIIGRLRRQVVQAAAPPGTIRQPGPDLCRRTRRWIDTDSDRLQLLLRHAVQLACYTTDDAGNFINTSQYIRKDRFKKTSQDSMATPARPLPGVSGCSMTARRATSAFTDRSAGGGDKCPAGRHHQLTKQLRAHRDYCLADATFDVTDKFSLTGHPLLQAKNSLQGSSGSAGYSNNRRGGCPP